MKIKSKMSVTTLLFALTSINSFAGSKTLSAIRYPDETYEEAKLRVYGPDSENKAIPGSAEAVSVPYTSLLSPQNVALVPSWSSMSQINSAFREVRNKQFIYWTSASTPTGMMRRSSWLYPDDGCFARAELMKSNLQAAGYPGVKKMFVFGNLGVSTPNHPNRFVTWWYHVAPVAKLNNQLYIFDPALDSSTPLAFANWASRMGITSSMKFAICDEDTYNPDYSCAYSSPVGSATSDQIYYLTDEWNRTIQLGMNPLSVLGSNPPWNMSSPF